jgi:hypothetical protein
MAHETTPLPFRHTGPAHFHQYGDKLFVQIKLPLTDEHGKASNLYAMANFEVVSSPVPKEVCATFKTQDSWKRKKEMRNKNEIN